MPTPTNRTQTVTHGVVFDPNGWNQSSPRPSYNPIANKVFDHLLYRANNNNNNVKNQKQFRRLSADDEQQLEHEFNKTNYQMLNVDLSEFSPFKRPDRKEPDTFFEAEQNVLLGPY